MHVEMIGDSRSGTAPQVGADIDAVGLIRVLDRPSGQADAVPKFGVLVIAELVELLHPTVGQDHDVARRVRVSVENREDPLPSPDDQGLLVR